MAVSETDDAGEQSTVVPSRLAGRSLTVFHVGLAVAVAHLVFILFQPAPTAVEIVVFEGLLCLFLAGFEFYETRSPTRALAVVLLFVAIGGGLLAGFSQGVAVWQAALLLLVAVSLLLYAVYRYQLFVLGTLGENE